MSAGLHLRIATPESAVVDARDVRAIGAMDDSGHFGIWPGHADLLTVLPASVVRWRGEDGTERYCAVRGGVLTLTGGHEAAIACRAAVLGDRLDTLEAEIRTSRAAETDADRRARVTQTRLHAQVIRRLMQHMHPDTAATLEALTGGERQE